MGRVEDLNNSGQTREQPRETLLADSVLESPGARRFVKDSTTADDGVGGGEWSATMVSESTEMPGASARAVESLKAGAGAANDLPESGAQRPATSEEQAARP